MTWPFENNTNGIVKNLAKRNLKSEKRRNVMVIVSVVLSAFLISLSGLTGVSLMQTEKKKVIDSPTPTTTKPAAWSCVLTMTASTAPRT